MYLYTYPLRSLQKRFVWLQLPRLCREQTGAQREREGVCFFPQRGAPLPPPLENLTQWRAPDCHVSQKPFQAQISIQTLPKLQSGSSRPLGVPSPAGRLCGAESCVVLVPHTPFLLTKRGGWAERIEAREAEGAHSPDPSAVGSATCGGGGAFPLQPSRGDQLQQLKPKEGLETAG